MSKRILLFLLLLVLLFSLNDICSYLLVLLGGVSYVLLPQKLYWDNTAMFLLLFSFFYAFVIFINGQVDSWTNWVAYLLCPVAFYRLGQYFASAKITEEAYVSFWTMLLVCYTLPLAYETIISINRIGLVNPFRTMGSEGEGAWAATLYGLHASLGLGGVTILFSTLPKIGKQKLLLLGCSIVSLLTVIHLVNRTGLVVLVACITVVLLYMLKSNRKRLILPVIFVVIIVLMVLYLGIDEDIVDAYARREQVETSNVFSAGGRMERWLSAFTDIFVYPLGFIHKPYVHNLWFDIARVAGLLPFVFFLLATVSNYRRLIIICKNGEMGLTPFFLGLNVAMFLSCFVEPVIEGSILYFCFFLFLWGSNKGMYVKGFGRSPVS